MLNRRVYAAAAGGLLLAGFLAWVSASLGPPPHFVAKPQCGEQQNCVAERAVDNNSSLLLWASQHEHAIVPLTAIGALVAGVLLVFVTGGLWSSTRSLTDATKRLGEAEHAQSAAMRESNELASRQYLLASSQNELAVRTHELNRTQFLENNRPRITIRGIGIAKPVMPGDVLFRRGLLIGGTLVVVNSGGSPAIIKRAEYRFYWSGWGLPNVPPMGPENVKQLLIDLPYRMLAHESCLVGIESNEPIGAEDDAILQGNMGLWVMGSILYANLNENERWMGFCRKYSKPEIPGGEGSFIPVDNPDYEYED